MTLPLAAQEQQPAPSDSPYGVCAHIAGKDPLMPQKLAEMKKLGIRSARADFTWSGIEHPQGTWHFENTDRLLDEAEKNGITILPILDYGTAWATPAYRHLDAWTEYVRQVVSRYKDRIRVWEVWNEPNLKGFWSEEPNGANYATLLKAAYETIKSIDPELKVLYAGLAGVPLPFFEDSLKAGAGDYFDIMNIHPYRGGLSTLASTQDLIDAVESCRTMMRKYNVPVKPIWITEMGWASLPNYRERDRLFLSKALDTVYPDGTDKEIYILNDKRYPASSRFSLASLIPERFKTRAVTLDDLKNLSPDDCAALFLPPGEAFPATPFPSLVEYVKNGGTLILIGGVPLYYAVTESDGKWTRASNAAPDSFRAALRIGWRAWWIDKSAPEKAPIKPTDRFFGGASDSEREEILKMYQDVTAGRYLTDSRLKPGDQMISLFDAQSGDFSSSAAALYRFNSDFHGNLIVSTISTSVEWTNISTLEDQAVFLPQAILTSFAAGIEKYFWYEFQAMEHDLFDKESHFGIVHADLTPKPAAEAYRTLIDARPDGSKTLGGWRQGDFAVVGWDLPNDGKNGSDGKKRRGWALWSPDAERIASLRIEGKVERAFDYLGRPVDLTEETRQWTLRPEILYIVGPEKITLGSFGLFMHFLPNESTFDRVAEFEVQALADQVERAGADWFVLTMYQNSGWFNAPNAEYDRVTGFKPGERCAERDLPMELADELAKRGIRFGIYLTGQVPNRAADAQKAFGLAEGPADQKLTLEFAQRWGAVFREWSLRYGPKVSGWWIDGCYAWCDFNEEIAAVYRDALRTGNPEALAAFNPGVKKPEWKTSDYTAGEINEPFEENRFAPTIDGQRAHILTYFGSRWAGRDTRFTVEEWGAWLRKAREGGLAVTIDIGPNFDPAAGPVGGISDKQFRRLLELKPLR